MLTDDNFVETVVKYTNHCYTLTQLKEELRTITIIQSLIKKYKTNSKINTRLVLNYFIILHNQFGNFLYQIMLFKTDKDIHPEILAFMDYMYIIPDDPSLIINNKIQQMLKEL